MHCRGLSRSLAVLVVLVTVCSLVVDVPRPPAASAQTPALGPDRTDRLAGRDRYATAAAIATATFPTGAGTVYIATGKVYADALAGGPLAAANDAPILLVGRHGVPAATARALRRLAPDRIVVLGGAAAVSDDTVEALGAFAAQPVTRLAGRDRFATAAAISAAAFPTGAPTAYLATGRDFPDALAGGAAAGLSGGPVLLVTRDAVPQSTLNELARLQPDTVALLGGVAAIGDPVLAAVGSAARVPVRRLAGADRYATAAAISQDTHHDGVDTVFLSTGRAFPDALAVGPVVARDGGALLLASRDCVPLAVRDEIARLSPERLVVVGGEAALAADAAALEVCGDLPPPPTYGVDTSLQPGDAAVEPIGDSGPRPVARLRSSGVATDLVADELLLSTDSGATLDAFLATTGGTLLRTIPAIGRGAPTHVVRVQPSAGDPAILPATMQWLFGGTTGEHVLSDTGALGTLALAAAARAEGLTVGLNLLADDDGIRERRLIESAQAPDNGVSRNAFSWDYMRRGHPGLSALEGRRLLHLAGQEGALVPVAVIDRGFAATNPDYPSGVTGDGQMGPGTPWHGTDVAITLAGVADNGVGSVGSAHPGVELQLLNRGTTTDQWIAQLQTAIVAGADVVNMSFSGSIAAGDAIFADVGESVTEHAAALGMVVIATAGNDGVFIDDVDCLLNSSTCWEDAWRYPCENNGVICVGGIDLVQRDGFDGIPILHNGSNFGCTDLGSQRCSVDVYGPFEVWSGSQPPNTSDDVLRRITGTSFAAPYVAGVMAQIIAARPQVPPTTAAHLFLLGTARTNLANITRVVQGEAAVRAALAHGGRRYPPSLRVLSPLQGEQVSPGAVPGVELLGDAHDVEDGDFLPVAWRLIRQSDGTVTQIPAGNPPFLPVVPPGEYVVRASVTDSDGNLVVEDRDITVVNQPPSVEITQPADGEQVTQGLGYTLRATAHDVDEPGLPCANYVWERVDGQSPQQLGSGCAVTVAFTNLGSHAIRVTVTDSFGATASDVHTIQVVECGDSGPPCVAITSPAAGDALPPQQPTQLVADATDPDGDAMSFTWTVSWQGGGPVVIGTQKSVTWTPDDHVPSNCGGREATLVFTATAPDGARSDSQEVFLTFPPC